MTARLIAAVGGAAGSILRFAVQKALNASFPAGTLAVNAVGCILIGVFWALLKNSEADKKLLLMTGFCGGFTTFSAFAAEGLQMLQSARWVPFLFYTSASVIGGLLAVFAGFKLFSS